MVEVSTQKTGWRPAPPPPIVMLHVASMLLPVLVLVIFAKVQRYIIVHQQMGLGFSLSDFLGVLSPDLILLPLVVFFWFLILSKALHFKEVSRGCGRKVGLAIGAQVLAITLLHSLTVFFLVAAAFEHTYFLVQRVPLDGYMVAYAISEWDMLQPVIASKLTVVHYLFFGGMGVFWFLPFVLNRLKWVKRRTDLRPTKGDWSRPEYKIPYLVFGGMLVVGMLSSFFSVDENLNSLSSNTTLTVLSEAWSMEEQSDEVEITEPLSDRLQLVRTEETRAYNVVVISLESTRAASLKMYGGPHDVMPFLESLAKRGQWVEEAYTVVPHTSKALVSIHCGIYPKIVPPIDETAPGAIPEACLAELLRREGYATVFFQPAEERYEGRDALVRNMGFETFYGKESLPSRGFHESSYFGYEDDIMIKPSLEWIDKQSKPFYLAYMTLSAHHDYVVPNSLEPREFVEDEEHNKYLNTLVYTDRFLKKLFRGFEERGLMDNTFFVLMGDHGEGFGEHVRKEHDNVIYEEGLKVPMLILGPGIEARSEPISGLRQIVDSVPTILDVLGFKTLGGSQVGRSLLSSEGHESLYYSCYYYNFCMAYREGGRKTIYHYKRRKTQVFDLSSDPMEKEDLAKVEKADPAIIQKLRTWKRETNAWYGAHLKQQKERFVRTEKPEIAHPVSVRFRDEVEILGYDIDKTTVKVGESLTISYFFRGLKEKLRKWKLFVHIVGPNGRFVNADHVPVSGAYPISKWKIGEYVEDQHIVRIGPKNKPGRYTVMLGLWDNTIKDETGQRAEATSKDVTIGKDRRVHLIEFRVVP
jgi:arylsulfatase A-like enzyme